MDLPPTTSRRTPWRTSTWSTGDRREGLEVTEVGDKNPLVEYLDIHICIYIYIQALEISTTMFYSGGFTHIFIFTQKIGEMIQFD